MMHASYRRRTYIKPEVKKNEFTQGMTATNKMKPCKFVCQEAQRNEVASAASSFACRPRTGKFFPVPNHPHIGSDYVTLRNISSANCSGFGTCNGQRVAIRMHKYKCKYIYVYISTSVYPFIYSFTDNLTK